MKYYCLHKPPPTDEMGNFWCSQMDFLDNAIVPENQLTFPHYKWGFWNHQYYIPRNSIESITWTIIKPADVHKFLVWIPEMDFLDGLQLEDIPKIDLYSDHTIFLPEYGYTISSHWLFWNGRQFPEAPEIASLLGGVAPVSSSDQEPPRGHYHCGWCRQTKQQCKKSRSCLRCACWFHCKECVHVTKNECSIDCGCCACVGVHIGPTDGHLERFKPLKDWGVRSWPDSISLTLGETDIVPRIASMYVAIHYDLECAPRLIDTLATQMFYYILYASLGEARHMSHELRGGKILHELGISVRSYSRTSSYNTLWLYAHRIVRRFGPLFVLDALMEIFSARWNRGYGGPKWHSMVKLAHDYYTLKITKLTFVDTVIDLVHNNGWALNKYYMNTHWCTDTRRSATMKTVLDTKFYDASQLVDILTPECLDKEIAEWLTYQARLEQYGLRPATSE